jgi:hypothetical protein
MVSMLVLNAVDRGLDQSKEYKIGICCFYDYLAALRSKKNGLVGSES